MKIKAETLFLKSRNISIPVLPQNYRATLALCQDKMVSSKQLEKIISLDYGLSWRILRFVNSAFFSLEKNDFFSFRHIIVLIGLDNLKNNILRAKTIDIKKANLNTIYLGVGLFISFISEKLATELHLDSDKAKVCGLFQNLGEVVVTIAIPKIIQMCLLPGSFIIEKKRFSRFCGGYDPRSLGDDLAKFWNFPELIRVAINPDNFDLKSLSKGDQKIILIIIALNELITTILSKEKKEFNITNFFCELENITKLKKEKIEDIFLDSYYKFEKKCPFFYFHLEKIGFFKKFKIE